MAGLDDEIHRQRSARDVNLKLKAEQEAIAAELNPVIMGRLDNINVTLLNGRGEATDYANPGLEPSYLALQGKLMKYFEGTGLSPCIWRLRWDVKGSPRPGMIDTALVPRWRLCIVAFPVDTFEALHAHGPGEYLTEGVSEANVDEALAAACRRLESHLR